MTAQPNENGRTPKWRLPRCWSRLTLGEGVGCYAPTTVPHHGGGHFHASLCLSFGHGRSHENEGAGKPPSFALNRLSKRATHASPLRRGPAVMPTFLCFVMPFFRHGRSYFLDRATERAILSSLKIVLNSMFLLIHSFLLMTESVIAPL